MRPAPLLALAAGCAADRVDVTGIDAFGAVAGASYTPAQTVEGFVLGDGTLRDLGIVELPPSLQVDSEARSCEERFQWWYAWTEASEALLEASANGNDTDALCEAVPAFLGALAAAVPDEAEHRLRLEFCADAACTADPAPGDFPLPEATADPVVAGMSSGTLTYRNFARERWYRLEDAWDPGSCAFDEDWRDQEDERAAVWTLVDGTTEVRTVEAGARVEVHVESLLVDENVRADGRLVADAEAGWCDLPGPDRVVYVE